MLGSRRRSKKVHLRALQGHSRRNLIDSFITGQCDNSEWILPTNLPHWMCVQSSFYHQQWIDTGKSRFKLKTNSILLAHWSKRQRASRSCKDWLQWTTSCTILGRNIKTRYFGLILILRFTRDWHSFRLDRMQSSFLITTRSRLDQRESSIGLYCWTTASRWGCSTLSRRSSTRNVLPTNPTNPKTNLWSIRATWGHARCVCC